MSALLWRVLYAVIAVVLIFLLLPPLLRILGLSLSGDVDTVIRVVVGGLALLYIIRGNPFPAP